MHMLPYYIGHTFVNSVKKLFRTWVAIFICVVLGIGLIGGIVGYTLGSVLDDETIIEEEEEIEEQPMTAEDIALMYQIIELVAGGVVLAYLVWSIYSSENAAKAKSSGQKGSLSLFSLADVNLLFPSPNLPQTVLLFRTILQMGLILAGSLYLIFQLPNLVINLGLSLPAALCILLAWVTVLFVGKLINIFCYTVTATHTKLKKFILPVSLGIPVAVGLGYAVMYSVDGNYYNSAVRIFASPASRMIPIWGWIKGMVIYSIEGRWGAVLAAFCATMVTCVLFIWLIWHFKADFYEDALQGACDSYDRIQQVKQGKKVPVKHKKKERVDTEIGKGQGAGIFFTKNLFARTRSARLKYFTGLTSTYLVTCLFIAGMQIFLSDSHTSVILGAIITFIMFCANFGNPIGSEMDHNYLYLVPEEPWKKLGSALLYSIVNAAMDVLPAFWIGCLLLQVSPLSIVGWTLFLLSMELFNSVIGLLLSLGLPSSLHISILAIFHMFGKSLVFLPSVIALIIGGAFGYLDVTLIIIALYQTALGIILFLPCGSLLKNGQK